VRAEPYALTLISLFCLARPMMSAVVCAREGAALAHALIARSFYQQQKLFRVVFSASTPNRCHHESTDDPHPHELHRHLGWIRCPKWLCLLSFFLPLPQYFGSNTAFGLCRAAYPNINRYQEANVHSDSVLLLERAVT
jgi:hypothetical protein